MLQGQSGKINNLVGIEVHKRDDVELYRQQAHLFSGFNPGQYLLQTGTEGQFLETLGTHGVQTYIDTRQARRLEGLGLFRQQQTVGGQSYFRFFRQGRQLPDELTMPRRTKGSPPVTRTLRIPRRQAAAATRSISS